MVIVCTCIAGGGCRGAKMYDGPRLNADQVAQVTLVDCTLEEFDGNHYGFFVPGPWLEVTPGHHSIKIWKRWQNFYTGESTIDFAVEADHSYRVTSWEHVSDLHKTADFIYQNGDVLGVVIAGPILLAEAMSDSAKRPPADAYLWVEEQSSHEVVGGTAPPPGKN